MSTLPTPQPLNGFETDVLEETVPLPRALAHPELHNIFPHSFTQDGRRYLLTLVSSLSSPFLLLHSYYNFIAAFVF